MPLNKMFPMINNSHRVSSLKCINLCRFWGQWLKCECLSDLINANFSTQWQIYLILAFIGRLSFLSKIPLFFTVIKVTVVLNTTQTFRSNFTEWLLILSKRNRVFICLHGWGCCKSNTASATGKGICGFPVTDKQGKI